LDELMAVDTFKLGAFFSERWNFFQKIKNAHFDLIVVSNPDKFFHFTAFFSRIPYRIGYPRKWGFFLNKTTPVSLGQRLRRHEIENNLELVKIISDQAWDGKVVIPVDEKAVRKIDGLLERYLLPKISVVAVHPGTSDPAKRWPVENFAAVIDKTISKDVAVVLVGGKEEIGFSKELIKKTHAQVTDWTGQLSLGELAAFLSHARVQTLISSDSGPVHIAWMLGKPVVVFFAKNTAGSHPDRWGPKSPKSEVIYKPINEITVEEVLECLAKVLRP